MTRAPEAGHQLGPSLAPHASRLTPAEAHIAALAARYQAGDASALAALHHQLSPAIRSVLGHYRQGSLPGTLSPQDMAQQSWVILAELASRWRPSGSFLAYFVRSFPRQVQRYVRRARPTQQTRLVQVTTVPHDELLSDLERITGASGHAEEGSFLDEHLRSLPFDQRVALVLRVMEGRGFDDIGRALKVSRASAHRIFRRALAALGGQPPAVSPERAGLWPPSDLVEVVRALHGLAAPNGALPGRRRIAAALGIGRRPFTAIMEQLEAAGAVVERGPTRSGRLVDPTPDATLQRLAETREAGCRSGVRKG